jgi:hypothetical protein
MRRLLGAILYGVFFAAITIGVRATFDGGELLLVTYWAGIGAMAGFWTANTR